MDNPDKNEFSRRDFLVRSAKAGMSLLTAGTASYLFYDSAGPRSGPQTKNLIDRFDFSVPAEPGKSMCIMQTADRTAGLRKALKLMGGMGRFIKKGDTVLIKPNVAFASAPQLGATANPALVAETVKQCLSAGAGRVIVTDNPINDPASCFLLSGIGDAARNAGAEILMPEPGLFTDVTLRGGRLISNWPLLFSPLRESHKLIGIAPVKSHHRSGASLSMKNWYGLLGGRRNIFHQDINTIISELATLIKPTMVILDGTEVMVTNGPTGGSKSDLERKNRLIISCDQVAADSFACTLLGRQHTDFPFIAKAEKAGAGTADFRALEPITGRIV